MTNEIETLPQRVFDKILFEPNTGCWLWVAALKNNGYGYCCPIVKGGSYYAHRVLYGHFNGPIPPKLELDHLCLIKRCVSPYHTEAVTKLENMRRRGPNQYAGRSRCSRGHEYMTGSFRLSKEGWRYCISCEKVRHES